MSEDDRGRSWRAATIIALPVAIVLFVVVLVFLGMGEPFRPLGIALAAVGAVALSLILSRAGR
jgi:predicted RND superfamily exporter protein